MLETCSNPNQFFIYIIIFCNFCIFDLVRNLFFLQSSLLLTILRELPLKSGNIEISGMISYASQEPWLFAGSVRQNILFGLPMDKDRYKQVRHFSISQSMLLAMSALILISKHI